MSKKAKQIYNDCLMCMANALLAVGIIGMFGLALWTVFALPFGPITTMRLHDYLSLEEQQCNITRIEVPEQLPSPDYTNYWKGCMCGVSSIPGHVPCLKYYTNLEPSKMVIREIKFIGLRSEKSSGDCTYSNNNCQCDDTSLNATVARMIQLKENETGTYRTCYSGDGDVYFKKTLEDTVIILMCLSWGWLFIICVGLLIYGWYHYECECCWKKKEHTPTPVPVQPPIAVTPTKADSFDTESQISIVSKPPGYDASNPPPPGYTSNRETVV